MFFTHKLIVYLYVLVSIQNCIAEYITLIMNTIVGKKLKKEKKKGSHFHVYKFTSYIRFKSEKKKRNQKRVVGY